MHSLCGRPEDALARKACGKISSTPVYDKAKVVAIRGVGCPKARKVARRYDHDSKQTGSWQRALAHVDLPCSHVAAVATLHHRSAPDVDQDRRRRVARVARRACRLAMSRP